MNFFGKSWIFFKKMGQKAEIILKFIITQSIVFCKEKKAKKQNFVILSQNFYSICMDRVLQFKKECKKFHF